MFDSQDFFKTLQDAQDWAQGQLQAHGLTGSPNITIYLWPGKDNNPIDIRLEYSAQYPDRTEAKVKGKDLRAMTQELIRRLGFDQSQTQLQIGHQIVEESAQ